VINEDWFTVTDVILMKHADRISTAKINPVSAWGLSVAKKKRNVALIDGQHICKRSEAQIQVNIAEAQLNP